MAVEHLSGYARPAPEGSVERGPVESGARIALATGRYVLMADHHADRVATCN